MSVWLAHPLGPALDAETVWVSRQRPSQRMCWGRVGPHRLSPHLCGSRYQIYYTCIYPSNCLAPCFCVMAGGEASTQRHPSFGAPGSLLYWC